MVEAVQEKEDALHKGKVGGAHVVQQHSDHRCDPPEFAVLAPAPL